MERMKRIEGRKGQSTEYVQFNIPNFHIVAQKGSGGFWFVFKVPVNDGVETLDQFETKEAAVNKAQEIAENLLTP